MKYFNHHAGGGVIFSNVSKKNVNEKCHELRKKNDYVNRQSFNSKRDLRKKNYRKVWQIKDISPRLFVNQTHFYLFNKRRIR